MKIIAKFYKDVFTLVGQVLDICGDYVEVGGFKNCLTAIMIAIGVTWPALLVVMYVFYKLSWWIFQGAIPFIFRVKNIALVEKESVNYD